LSVPVLDEHDPASILYDKITGALNGHSEPDCLAAMCLVLVSVLQIFALRNSARPLSPRQRRFIDDLVQLSADAIRVREEQKHARS